MKKLKMVFIIVFIVSISMIAFQIRDKVNSEKINEEVSKIYYKNIDNREDKDKITEAKYKDKNYLNENENNIERETLGTKKEIKKNYVR